MLPETEELFKKWLKLQIWQYRISIVVKIFFVLFIIFSGWFSYSRILPMITQQIENTTSLLKKVPTVPQTSGSEAELMQILQKQLESQLEQKPKSSFDPSD